MDRGILHSAPYVSLSPPYSSRFLTLASCTLRFWRCSLSVRRICVID
jgi:hypothetical protein